MHEADCDDRTDARTEDAGGIDKTKTPAEDQQRE